MARRPGPGGNGLRRIGGSGLKLDRKEARRMRSLVMPCGARAITETLGFDAFPRASACKAGNR
jgi:hypothetical protein